MKDLQMTAVEEAAERIYREYPNNPLDKPDWRYNRDVNCFKKRKAFIAGAKFQAERMYSEEEVLVKLYECLGHFAYQHNIVINGNEIDKWFEQFKKK
jgi:hypothetical protein